MGSVGMSVDQSIGSPQTWSIVGVHGLEVSVLGLPIIMFFKVEMGKKCLVINVD